MTSRQHRAHSRFRPGIIALAALLAITPALAQDDLFVPKPEKQAPAPPRTGKSGGGGGKQSLPSCVMVTVAPGPVRMDGLTWDLGKSTAAPDIRIVEQTTGTRGACDQTWTCSVTLKPVTNTLQLDLSDADFDAADPIGNGSCAIGKTCQIGVAKVAVKKC